MRPYGKDTKRHDDNVGSDRLRRWGAFGGCILVILIFMFGIAPMMEKAPYVKPIVQFVEERGIDATALYYTEIEEFSVAEMHMQHTMDYPPRIQVSN